VYTIKQFKRNILNCIDKIVLNYLVGFSVLNLQFLTELKFKKNNQSVNH